ncbi:MAG: Calx-beta domain-containing protein, partial [Limisphaerales bacterium]
MSTAFIAVPGTATQARTAVLAVFGVVATFCMAAKADSIFEPFSADPVAAGRFTVQTAGTESSFQHQTVPGTLRTVLDVDTSTASYLSAPFAIPTSDRDSLSFSFAFRIEEVDDRNTPTAFIGLLTPLHVENFGDGLTVALATSRQSASLGRLVATANIDNAGYKTGGAEIPLDSATDYLAAATYSSLTRKLTVDIYSGTQFTVRIGRSETVLPAGRTLRLTHLGIQNGGARTVDSQTGSLTVTLDDLATPGRPPITLFAEDVEVPEGTDGAVQAAVQVVLSSPADVPVSVQYFTADVTARAGADYQHVADSLVIPAGAGGARLLIPIIPDALAEASEALRVVFLNPVNANLGTPEVLVTLLDDDTPRVAAGAIEVVEGAPGTHVVRVPVRLGNPSTLPVQVDYATEDATAAAGSDYTGTQGTLVFPPETTEREIEVRVLGDLISEGNESFLLRLSSPVNATLASDDSSDGRVTLLDDDPIPIIDVADATVVEGHAGPVSASVPVRLSNASAIPVTVAFSTADDSARAGSDYLARNGVLRFQPGETELPVAITVLGDTTTEGDESFRLILSDPVGGRLATAEARITILDDERTPTLRISDASVVEGAVGGTTTMTLDVDLTPTATLPVTVQFATFAASAGAGVDFVSASSTLTFAPGTSRQSISVTVLGDDDAEPDETFTVRLSNPLNAILDRAEATGTILTDDSVTLSVDDVTVTEGDGVSVQAVFSVSLKGAPVEPVTVGYFTANVTAQAGIDYQAAGAILRFQPGQTLQTVSVPVLGDFIDEPAETFELRLHTPSGATLSRAVGTATVLDNDPPSLIPSPVQVVEGSEGPTNARVVVRLSSPTFEEVQVDFQTVERTATSGTDYVPASGTLVFPAGTSERFIDVSVLGDTVDEADETFAVRLLRPRGALLAATEALVTIRDDDEAPRILIENREVTECSEGNASVIFEVTLSEPSEQVVTVEYSTFDDSAIAGQDYVPVTGTVVFPPGTTVQRVEVPLLCDTTDEPDESFGVGLGQPVNGFVGGDGRGRGRVIDDDPPELSVESVAVHEGDHGLTQAIFRIRLSSASTEVVTVDFSTRDESAFQGTDYAAVSGVVRFAPGSLREEVGVPVIGDSLPEDDETFLVLLANPLNASLAASTAQGIIRDDDQPELRIEDVTAVETDAGTFVARLVLTLTRTSPELVSFAYRTRDETARAGQDYVASNGVVTFPPGESRRELELTGFGDVLIEGPETFTVLFSDPVRALLPDDSAQVTLVDNDGAPVLTVSDVPIDEGQAGPRNLVFAFRLSAPSSVPVSVRYATADATATAGSDYVARSGTVNFAPGITNQTVPVPVLGDAFSESDETFLLVLTDPVQAVLARPQAIGTIRNDDPSPRLTVADEIVEEGPPGRRTQLNFRVQLEPPSSTAVSVRYATLPRTATAGSDFEPSSGVLTFEPGTREKTVAVTVFGDSEIEPGETLVLSLTDPFNAELARTDAVGTILDDDGIRIRIADATTREPDLGSVGLSFVVSLERAATQVITVDYSTRDGTAQAGIDYSGSTTTSTSTLSFPAGLTQQTLTIPVLGDTLDEPDETLQVILSNPVNGVLSRGSATGTILDNDPPSLEVDDVTVVGSQGGAVNATFTVRLSTPSDEQVTVAFATANGTANSGTDYSETSRDLVFSPGQVQRTVDVEVKGNTLDEDTEHFLVNLSNPVNATPGRMQGRGTILNRISVNRPPEVVLTSPADGANLLGPTNLTLTATATDAEGPVARVEFFAGSISLGSDSAAPFAWTWNQAPQGRHVLTARATDSGGLVATSAPVRIVIALPNTPPTIASQPTKTTLEDASSEPIPFTIADTETTSDLLQVSVRSSDPALLPADGLRLTTANGQGTLTVTPAANGFGTATVEFTVRDPGGLVGTHALTVNVLPVNDPPTLALIPDAAGPEDSAPLPLSLTGIGTGAPLEVQALTFGAS